MSDCETVKIWRETEDDAFEVTVDVEFSVEPSEYEGGHLFHRGGVNIESTRIDGKEVDLTESEREDVLTQLYKVVDVPSHHYRGDY